MLPASLSHSRWFAFSACLCLFAQHVFAQNAEPVAPPPVQVEEEAEGVETLTRGALHEAFADQVSQDLVTGVLAPVAPPEAIEELPPEIKPEGDDIEWIPGYWFWDDERDDYIWISGVWRKTPPGRRWVPGYWIEVDGRYRRVSGMWSGGSVSNLEYLPYPPDSLERGPASPSPSDDYFWAPGCWIYYNGGYSWRPGHWERYRDNWVWMPARYVWLPSGCLYQGGFWDYPFASRGQLYSPVYFHNHIYQQPHYQYRPCYTINTSSIFLHLFVRSGHNHYFFGNYYGNQHRHHYHPWYDYHHVGRRYDPLITHAHGRSHHAGIDYVKRMRDWNSYFTRHSDHRPPATVKRQHAFERRHRDFAQLKHVALGRSINQTLHDRDSILRSHRTSTAQRDQLRKRVAEVHTLAESRRRHETGTLAKRHSELVTKANRGTSQGRDGTANSNRHGPLLTRDRNAGVDARTKPIAKEGVDAKLGNAKRGGVTASGRIPTIANRDNASQEKDTRDNVTRGSVTRNRTSNENVTRNKAADLTKTGRQEQDGPQRPMSGQLGGGRAAGLSSRSGRDGNLPNRDRDALSEERVRQDTQHENRWGRGRINRVGSTQTPSTAETRSAVNATTATAAKAAAAQAAAQQLRKSTQPNSRTTDSRSVTRQPLTTPTPQPSYRRDVQPSPTPARPVAKPTPPKVQSVRPASPSANERLQAARAQFRAQFQSRAQANQPSTPSVVKPSFRPSTPTAPVGPQRPMNIPKPGASNGRSSATTTSPSRQATSPATNWKQPQPAARPQSRATFTQPSTPSATKPSFRPSTPAAPVGPQRTFSIPKPGASTGRSSVTTSPSRQATSPARTWKQPQPAARPQSRATFNQPRPSTPSSRPTITRPKAPVAPPRASFRSPPQPSVQNRAPVGPQRNSFSNKFRGGGRGRDRDKD